MGFPLVNRVLKQSATRCVRGFVVAAAVTFGGFAFPVEAAGQTPGCDDFQRAAATLSASIDNPLLEQARGIWSRVNGSFQAMNPTTIELVLLPEQARMTNGAVFPPYARICAGPPQIFVSHALVSLILKEAPQVYGPSFLAFVFAHELAHRVNDFDPEGTQVLPFAGREETPGRIEALADRRAAFFAVLAGYPVRHLASRSTVDHFLKSVANVGKTVRGERHGELVSALKHFSHYEELYQVGVVLTLSGDPGGGRRLLAWADALMSNRDAAVPEVSIMRALALMSGAAPSVLQGARVPTSAANLRCKPVFPGHTTLWSQRVEPAHMGAAVPDAARRDLEESLDLLARARKMGGNEVAISSGEACALSYLGRHEEARQAHERALVASSGRGARETLEVLRFNGAFLAFLALNDAHSANVARRSPHLRAWNQARNELASFPEFRNAIDLVLGNPGGKPSAEQRSKPSTPGATTIATFLPDRLVMDVAPGKCPPGWGVDFTLPPSDTRATTLPGLTACRQNQDAPSGRFKMFHAFLSAATDPAAPPLDAWALVATDLPMDAAPLGNWEASCDSMLSIGASDRGEEVRQVRCRGLDIENGLVFVGPGRRVTRVVRMED